MLDLGVLDDAVVVDRGERPDEAVHDPGALADDGRAPDVGALDDRPRLDHDPAVDAGIVVDRPSTRRSRVSRTRRLASSSGVSLPVSMNQPSSRSLRTTWPWSMSHWMASVISSSPRGEGWMARTAWWMVWSKRYTPDQGQVGRRAPRLLDQADDVADASSSSATPKRCGSGTRASRIWADRGVVAAVEGRGRRGLAVGLEAVDERLDALADEVVAEVHDEVVVAEEVPGDQHAVGQSERRGLVQVGDLEAPAGPVADRGHDLSRRCRRR